MERKVILSIGPARLKDIIRRLLTVFDTFPERFLIIRQRTNFSLSGVTPSFVFNETVRVSFTDTQLFIKAKFETSSL